MLQLAMRMRITTSLSPSLSFRATTRARGRPRRTMSGSKHTHSGSNLTTGTSVVVTAQDRCPQLEAGQEEGLAALRLEVSTAEKALSALGRARSLRELVLRSGCRDEEVGRIVREVLLVNKSLHTLTLDLRECSDHGATYLSELIQKTPSIKHLTLMLNNVTAAGAEILAAALPSSPLLSFTLYATQMDLHDCCVGDEGARLFASALPHCTHLTAFGFAQSGITPTGLEYLLQSLEENPRITSLNLLSNFINEVGAASISRFLSTKSHLQQLNLSENHYIGDEGARELALSLSHNSSLEVLCLKSCGIGQSGAKRFADPLAQNTSLRVLNLCGNGEIGDDGVEMIARGLRGNLGLRELDLSSCGVTDEGCDDLAGALSTAGTTLTHLTLHKNGIGDGGAVSLAHCLTKNSSLLVLVLSENPVGEKGVAALGKALEINTTLTSLVLGAAGGGDRGSRSPFPSTSRGTRDSESGKLAGTETSGSPVEARGEEGGRRGKSVLQMLPEGEQGSSSSSTLALVEALVSKNRRLAAYKKTVRELRGRVKSLEKESRDRNNS